MCIYVYICIYIYKYIYLYTRIHPGFERGEVLQALKLSNGKSQAASLMLIQSFTNDSR